MVIDQNEKLEEVLKLERENHEMLKGMRARQRWHTVFLILYWALLGGIAVATYHFLEPYLKTLLETYNSIQDGIGKISSFGG
ncbi:MAG TPA: hypothetical protein VJB98_03920 [Candidatus Paceibacterota bacterium]